MRFSRIMLFAGWVMAATISAPLNAIVDVIERFVDAMFKATADPLDFHMTPSLADVALAGTAPAYRHAPPGHESLMRTRAAHRNI